MDTIPTNPAMLTVTKSLLADLRKAHDVWFSAMHADVGMTAGTMSYRTESTYGRPHDSVPTISVGMRATGIPAGWKLFASIGCANSHDQAWHVAMHHLVKVGDRIAIRVCPDWHSNGYVKDAVSRQGAETMFDGLHADVLYLVIERDKPRGRVQRITIEIDQSICPDNTARMVRPV